MRFRPRRQTLVLSGLAAATMSGLLGATAVRIAGFIRQVVTARAFGLGSELDIFLLATVVPTLIGSIAGSAMNTALVPRLTALANEPAGSKLSQRFWLAIVAAGLLGVLMSGSIWLLADPISSVIGASGNEEFQRTLAATTRILAFVSAFLIVHEVVAAGLLAKGRFMAAAIIPIFTPVVVAVAVIGGARTAIDLAIATLVGGVLVVVIGALVAARQIGVPTWRSGLQPPRLRPFVRDSVALTAAMVLAQATPFIDKVMASWLAPGSVSALEFGSRVPEAFIGIAALGLANAVAQRSGSLVSQGKSVELVQLTRTLGRSIVVGGTVAAAALILISPWLVQTIYVGQSFTPENGEIVLGVQVAFLAQFPFYLLAIVASRMLASIRKTRWITLGTLLHLILSVGGNLVLMTKFGVSGIAAATSMAYAVTGILLWIVVVRLVNSTH